VKFLKSQKHVSGENAKRIVEKIFTSAVKKKITTTFIQITSKSKSTRALHALISCFSFHLQNKKKKEEWEDKLHVPPLHTETKEQP
jgi:hypothetical protein